MHYTILIHLLIKNLVAATPNLPIKSFSPDRYSWKMEKKVDDCTSYTSTVLNKEYIASKVECLVPSKLEVIGTILIDIENYPKWMDDCVETKIIKTSGDNLKAYDFWYHQHVPLLKDRDIILHSETTVFYPQKSIQINSYSEEKLKYDSNKNVIRMPAFFSWYNLEWIDRNHTRVTFLIDPDLGPGLPIGFSNNIIKNVPLNSIRALQKIAEDKTYQELAQNGYYAKVIDEGIKQGYLK